MTYEEQLQKMMKSLQKLSDRMNADKDAASPSFTDMRDSAGLFLNVMNIALHSPYALTEAQRKSIPALFRNMSDYAQQYFEDHQSFRFTTSGDNRRDLSSSLVTLLGTMQPFVRDYSDALAMSDNFHSSYASNHEERNIARLDDLFTSAIPRMKPADCFSIENPKFGSAAIFGKFAYLARQEAALHPESVRRIREAQYQAAQPQAPAEANRENHPAADNVQASSTIYQEAYRNLSAKLSQASFTEQMEFAQQLERYRISLLDRLSDSLERYRRESQDAIAAGHNAGPDPLVRLYADPDYRKLESLTLLESNLGTEAKRYAESFRLSQHFSERPSVVVMHNYMPGQENAFLNEEQRLQAGIMRWEADRAILGESSYGAYESCLLQPAHAVNQQEAANQPNQPAHAVNQQEAANQPNQPAEHQQAAPQRVDIQPLFDIYSQIMRDKESASPSFQAVRDRLGNFLSMNHRVISDPLAYDANMTMAMQAVKTYLDTHRGYIVHNYGQNRRDLIESAQDKLSNLHAALAADMEQKHIALDQAELAADPEQKYEMQKLNRLHHLTSNNFVPAPRRTDFTPTLKTKIFRGVMHGLASLVVGISSIISMPLWGLNRLKHRNDEFVQDFLDYERIPGFETREHFREFDPDKGSPNQPILNDCRRVPCIWETKTGGDPSLPPTISINAKQAHEGDLHASRGWDQEVGHASITLEYTKNDPLTGKPQRYRTSFGFYPRKIEVSSGINMAYIAAEGGKGGHTPGLLQNDGELHAHASITYTANNRQINKILVAAQTYAKDGYNMMTRNCVTFVKDMADIAGLDTKELFHESDFELGLAKGVGTAFALPVQDYFRMYGNHKMVRAQGQTVEDEYQILGQQQIASRDIVHYTQMQSMNFRLKGYNPSRLAEAIKASGRGNLMITDSDEGGNLLLPQDSSIVEVYETQMLMKIGNLTLAVEQSCRERNLPEEEISKVLSQMGGILQDCTGTSLMKNLKAGFKTLQGNGRSGRDLYHEKETSLNACSADFTELQNRLNRFYQDVLHNHQGLYVAFRDMTSLLTDMKLKADAKLQDLDNEVFMIVRNKEAGYRNNLGDEIDPSLEDASARRAFRFVKIVNNNRYTDIPTLAASALIYPDGASYVTDKDNIKLLDEINEKDLTVEQRKQKEQLTKRCKIAEMMSSSMSYYASAPSYTKGDLDFIFGKLVHYENANKHRGLSIPFQGFVWGKVLPPTQVRINDMVNQKINEHILSDPNRMDELKSALGMEVTKVVVESLCHDKNMVRQILSSIVQSKERCDLGDGAEINSANLADKKNNINITAMADFFESLKNSRFNAQIQTAVKKAVKEKGIDSHIDTSEFSNTVIGYLDQNLSQILFHIHESDMAYNYENQFEKEISESVQKLNWIKEELDAMPRFSKAFETLKPSLEQYENNLIALTGNQARTQEETRCMNGLKTMLDNGKNALKSLADQATLGRQSFNNKEKKEILQNLASVSFILFMNKMSPANKKAVLAKLGRDRGAYKRYIDRIAKADSFRNSMKDIRVNDLASAEGIQDLKNRCDNIFNREFYKQVHVNKIRQPML